MRLFRERNSSVPVPHTRQFMSCPRDWAAIQSIEESIVGPEIPGSHLLDDVREPVTTTTASTRGAAAESESNYAEASHWCADEERGSLPSGLYDLTIGTATAKTMVTVMLRHCST